MRFGLVGRWFYKTVCRAVSHDTFIGTLHQIWIFRDNFHQTDKSVERGSTAEPVLLNITAELSATAYLNQGLSHWSNNGTTADLYSCILLQHVQLFSTKLIHSCIPYIHGAASETSRATFDCLSICLRYDMFLSSKAHLSGAAICRIPGTSHF